MESTLAKGLAVIEWLARQQRSCRLVEVAQAFDLQRSNAHRTLQTLVACGWAIQDPAGLGYRASLRLFELGSLVDAATDLKSTLRPHLAVLAQETGETIHLAALEGAEIIYLDKIDSPLPVAAYSRVGGRAPAYCVASGKALLAALRLDAAALAARLGALAAHTPHTLIDLPALMADLEQVRERGYSENRQEWRLGVCGLGAPVFNARSEPVVAVGISLPAIRYTRAHARRISASLLDCAGRCSQALGWPQA
ncbi:MAG: IclR family transcriptional regulator [Burkholderiales bacterium]|nr:IclR family transcriptional regulator [Burkholderiales bacterium]